VSQWDVGTEAAGREEVRLAHVPIRIRSAGDKGAALPRQAERQQDDDDRERSTDTRSAHQFQSRTEAPKGKAGRREAQEELADVAANRVHTRSGRSEKCRGDQQKESDDGWIPSAARRDVNRSDVE
jgi:hypothetical protein